MRASQSEQAAQEGKRKSGFVTSMKRKLSMMFGAKQPIREETCEDEEGEESLTSDTEGAGRDGKQKKTKERKSATKVEPMPPGNRQRSNSALPSAGPSLRDAKQGADPNATLLTSDKKDDHAQSQTEQDKDSALP